MSELLPCPFCGGRASIRGGIHTKYVMCHVCEVMGPNLSRDDELIEQWNRRSTPASSPTAEDYEKAIAELLMSPLASEVTERAKAIARQRGEDAT